ncbi:hypothetical protein CLV31_104139 [Algoriphagus aquaeductus]|uniref:Uncharacterized protein n=1 Tax=Algoriphagus aquaeductus TaxID=475299 RepID=A0A326RU93_9BACT|nr:hypothetical protein CLV31_104139 [Algoriphagus aquaeductus]
MDQFVKKSLLIPLKCHKGRAMSYFFQTGFQSFLGYESKILEFRDKISKSVGGYLD